MSESKQLRVSMDIAKKIDNLHISHSGIEAKTVGDKISHLLWFYDKHKNQLDK